VLIALIVIIFLIQSVEAGFGWSERDARIVTGTIRGRLLRTAWALDGAELLASPARGNSCSGAEFGIDGDGGAETVAVAAEVAGARVVYATLEIRSRIHHFPTRREHRTVHHAAFLFREDFLFVVVALSAWFRLCVLAFLVRPPLVGESMSFGQNTGAIARREFVVILIVEVTAQSLHPRLEECVEFDVDKSAFVPKDGDAMLLGMNVVEKAHFANLEDFLGGDAHASIARHHSRMSGRIQRESEGDFFGAGDAGGAASHVSDGDVKVHFFILFVLRQNVLAFPRKLKMLSVKRREMGIAPSGAGAGALAFVTPPAAILTDAVFALALDLSTRRIQLAIVFAFARRHEHAFPVLVAHVVVLTLATSRTLVRMGTDNVLFERSALGLALLDQAIRPLFMGLTKRRSFFGAIEMRSNAFTFSPHAVFVFLIHLFSFAVIFSIGVTAAIGDGNAFPALVSDLAVGARATFRAHDELACVVAAQRHGATRRLTVVHARLEYLTWRAFDSAGVDFGSPIADSVTHALRVTPQIVANARHFVFGVFGCFTVAMINDAIGKIRSHRIHFVAFLKDVAS